MIFAAIVVIAGGFLAVGAVKGLEESVKTSTNLIKSYADFVNPTLEDVKEKIYDNYLKDGLDSAQKVINRILNVVDDVTEALGGETPEPHGVIGSLSDFGDCIGEKVINSLRREIDSSDGGNFWTVFERLRSVSLNETETCTLNGSQEFICYLTDVFNDTENQKKVEGLLDLKEMFDFKTLLTKTIKRECPANNQKTSQVTDDAAYKRSIEGSMNSMLNIIQDVFCVVDYLGRKVLDVNEGVLLSGMGMDMDSMKDMVSDGLATAGMTDVNFENCVDDDSKTPPYGPGNASLLTIDIADLINDTLGDMLGGVDDNDTGIVDEFFDTYIRRVNCAGWDVTGTTDANGKNIYNWEKLVTLLGEDKGKEKQRDGCKNILPKKVREPLEDEIKKNAIKEIDKTSARSNYVDAVEADGKLGIRGNCSIDEYEYKQLNDRCIPDIVAFDDIRGGDMNATEIAAAMNMSFCCYLTFDTLVNGYIADTIQKEIMKDINSMFTEREEEQIKGKGDEKGYVNEALDAVNSSLPNKEDIRVIFEGVLSALYDLSEMLNNDLDMNDTRASIDDMLNTVRDIFENITNNEVILDVRDMMYGIANEVDDLFDKAAKPVLTVFKLPFIYVGIMGIVFLIALLIECVAAFLAPGQACLCCGEFCAFCFNMTFGCCFFLAAMAAAMMMEMAMFFYRDAYDFVEETPLLDFIKDMKEDLIDPMLDDLQFSTSSSTVSRSLSSAFSSFSTLEAGAKGLINKTGRRAFSVVNGVVGRMVDSVGAVAEVGANVPRIITEGITDVHVEIFDTFSKEREKGRKNRVQKRAGKEKGYYSKTHATTRSKRANKFSDLSSFSSSSPIITPPVSYVHDFFASISSHLEQSPLSSPSALFSYALNKTRSLLEHHSPFSFSSYSSSVDSKSNKDFSASSSSSFMDIGAEQQVTLVSFLSARISDAIVSVTSPPSPPLASSSSSSASLVKTSSTSSASPHRISRSRRTYFGMRNQEGSGDDGDTNKTKRDCTEFQGGQWNEVSPVEGYERKPPSASYTSSASYSFYSSSSSLSSSYSSSSFSTTKGSRHTLREDGSSKEIDQCSSFPEEMCVVEDDMNKYCYPTEDDSGNSSSSSFNSCTKDVCEEKVPRKNRQCPTEFQNSTNKPKAYKKWRRACQCGCTLEEVLEENPPEIMKDDFIMCKVEEALNILKNDLKNDTLLENIFKFFLKGKSGDQFPLVSTFKNIIGYFFDLMYDVIFKKDPDAEESAEGAAKYKIDILDCLAPAKEIFRDWFYGLLTDGFGSVANNALKRLFSMLNYENTVGLLYNFTDPLVLNLGRALTLLYLFLTLFVFMGCCHICCLGCGRVLWSEYYEGEILHGLIEDERARGTAISVEKEEQIIDYFRGKDDTDSPAKIETIDPYAAAAGGGAIVPYYPGAGGVPLDGSGGGGGGIPNYPGDGGDSFVYPSALPSYPTDGGGGDGEGYGGPDCASGDMLAQNEKNFEMENYGGGGDGGGDNEGGDGGGGGSGVGQSPFEGFAGREANGGDNY